jgi:hypothetical protein
MTALYYIEMFVLLDRHCSVDTLYVQFKGRMASIDREVDAGDTETAEVVVEATVESDVLEDTSSVNTPVNNLVCGVTGIRVCLEACELWMRLNLILNQRCPAASRISELSRFITVPTTLKLKPVEW